MIQWEYLDRLQQIKLRDTFGHYLDTLPPGCSLDMKIAQFQEWLRKKGIQYNDGGKPGSRTNPSA
jgi:phage antirepressor YoqD-like protein